MLGTTQMVDVPNRAAWLVTGNNIQMSDELTRRTVWIRQDAKRDRPWDRDGFRHPDLTRWVMRHRHELVWACLVLIQNWVAAGKQPWSGRPLGSFESWCEVIGGILDAAGIEGFLENRAELYRRLDQETDQWRSFLGSWWQECGDAPVKSAEVLPLALEHLPGLFERVKETDRAQKTALGKALGERRDRRFGDLFLRQAGADGHAKGALWRLEAVNDADVPAQNGHTSAPHPHEIRPFSDSNTEDAELADVVSGVFLNFSPTDAPHVESELAGKSLPHLPQVPQTDSEWPAFDADVPADMPPPDALTSAGFPQTSTRAPEPPLCRICRRTMSPVRVSDVCGICAPKGTFT
jgi:hypothetical protein